MNPIDALVAQYPLWMLHILCFLLVYHVLGKWFFAPVSTHLDAREREFKTSAEDVAARKAALEKMTREYAERLAAADREAFHRTQELVREGLGRRTEVVSEAHERMVERIGQARADIWRQRDESLAALEPAVAELAADLVARFADPGMARTALLEQARQAAAEHEDEHGDADAQDEHDDHDAGAAQGGAAPGPESGGHADPHKKKHKKKKKRH
ncbi:MAG: ATP synthase F0 subunit B [Planctomycetes bacterium]|nr:ATP synthase F0 subunit B [Planctomycetota bacterium]